MFYLQLTVKSKNKKTLQVFTNFVKIFIKNKFKKIKFNNETIIKTTLLKSPHVHKKAQEHFQFKIYKKTILLHYFNLVEINFFLKRVLGNTFHDIKLKIDFFLQANVNLQILNFNHFYFNSKKHYFYKKVKTNLFFKILQLNGRFLLNFDNLIFV